MAVAEAQPPEAEEQEEEKPLVVWDFAAPSDNYQEIQKKVMNGGSPMHTCHQPAAFRQRGCTNAQRVRKKYKLRLTGLR